MDRFASYWRPLSRNALWVCVTFAASRLTIIVVMLFSRQILARGPHVDVSRQMEHGGTLLDLFTQWDGAWYRMIAELGYQPPTPFTAAFFPFYPILIRIVAFILPDFQIASLVVSNGCLLAAALLFDRLLRLDYDDATCRRVITFLMFNPVSFFLSSAYAESTFLLLSVGALLAARQGKWFVASLCGMCLSATRAPGLLIAVPLLVEFLRQSQISRTNLRAMFDPRILFFGLIPLGLVFFMLYCQFAFGDAFRPMHALKAGWDRALTPPYETFLHPQNFPLSHAALYRTLCGGGLILLALGLVVRLRPSYWAYAAVSVPFCLSWATLDGVPRYFSVIFPLYIVFALVTQRAKWIYEPMLAFSVALLTLCTILFANAYQMT